MLMIQNNLDPAVAQHPYELITYGGNGTVFQNWAQYLLTMKYLSDMTDEQTLVMYSGHPLGLFPSHRDAPRVVVTNGMVIPNYSSGDDYTRMAALGVTSYGQMTAGSYMYIGPQGIVHGTTITLLGAGRRYLGGTGDHPLAGKLYVTSGLGGMSGAQGKAAVIAGCVGVLAEVNPAAVTQAPRTGLGGRGVHRTCRRCWTASAPPRRTGRRWPWPTRATWSTCGRRWPRATSTWSWAATRPRCTSPTPAATTRPA